MKKIPRGPGGRIDPKDVNIMERLDLDKDLLLLENDIEAMGWDQPPRLYAILGKEGDYSLELIMEFAAHPVALIRAMVLGENGMPGGRLDNRVVGVAASVEAWRHAEAKDLAKHHPDKWKELNDLAVSVGFDPVTDAQGILDHTDKVLDKIAENFSPSNSPVRIENRVLTAIMRDGKGAMVVRDRGDDPRVTEVAEGGRVVVAMRALLTGCWPADPDLNQPE